MQFSQIANDFFAKQPVLVTGGAGFIGSHLTKQLASSGCTVKVIDDLSSGKLERLNGFDVEFIEGDILDDVAMSKAVDGCTTVFHLAAFVSVSNSVSRPDECNRTNIDGTASVVRHASKARCNRIVFASSAACYGTLPSVPSRENDELKPASPYATSKVAGESLIKELPDNLDGVSLRFFNVFGEGQYANSDYAAVVSAFLEAKASGNQPVIYGDGSQSRDFIHVSNIVHACLLAGAETAPFHGKCLNVGTGQAMSINELATVIFGDDVSPAYQPTRQGDVMHSLASIDAIQKALGFKCVTESADALRAMINPTQQSCCSHQSTQCK
ncbi:MAG: SDR family NAD(P)-dependent oxidoreductase [Planctomycetota bacterium]|nr:SDR family NAD(P)-dependent oxidoreductase [Planctomycetota bacterium]